MEWVEEELSAGLAWGSMSGWVIRGREGIVAMIKIAGWVYFCAGGEVMRRTRGQHRRQRWSLSPQGPL